jgi:hypothetical protein
MCGKMLTVRISAYVQYQAVYRKPIQVNSFASPLTPPPPAAVTQREDISLIVSNSPFLTRPRIWAFSPGRSIDFDEPVACFNYIKESSAVSQTAPCWIIHQCGLRCFVSVNSMSESPPERLLLLLLLFNFSSFCVYTQTILAARGQNLQAAPALISSLPSFVPSVHPTQPFEQPEPICG